MLPNGIKVVGVEYVAGRFLRAFQPIARVLPEVKAPERRVKFTEKLFWTAGALVLYFIMSEIPLFGLGKAGAQDSLYYYRVIFASSKGTLMELGIGPIVTAGLILQLLSGSGFIECDFSNPEDRSLFGGASKVLSIFITGAQASAYLVSGLFGNLDMTQSVIIFVQLLAAGVLLMLLDELIQKGWGIGSGISLFIMAGVAQTIMWSSFAIVPAPGEQRLLGVISALIGALISGNPLNDIVISPQDNPSLLGLGTTIAIFLFVIYAEGIRVELPLAHSRFRGFRGKYPIKLLYVSNLPVIFASALFGNVYFISQIVWSRFNPDNSNPLLNILGQFSYNATEGRTNPTGGIAYYVVAPRGFSSVISTPDSIVRAIIYAVILIAFCVVFSLTWLEVGGLDPRTVAKQLVDSGMQIPGFRRSERPVESLLRRYIPVVTILGGLIVGLLAAIADFLGAFGTGTGILLTVGIIYQYYQELVKERVTEMYPSIERILGG